MADATLNAAARAAAEPVNQSAAVEAYIMHHVTDSHEWSLPFLRVPLPDGLSLHGLMLILCASFLILIFGVLYKKRAVVPTGLTNLLELFVVFIRDQVAIANLGEKDGRALTPLLCSFFFFILGLNLMGLIPAFSTATANVNVTAALSTITLLFMVGGAIYKHGVIGFFKLFAPPGVPWPVLILLAPVEFLGLFIRTFALTIRLFANMLAGHIVIYSLLSLVVMFGAVALPTLLLALGIYLLEVGIAFLQAFIFTFLSAMFMGLLYHPQH